MSYSTPREGKFGIKGRQLDVRRAGIEQGGPFHLLDTLGACDQVSIMHDRRRHAHDFYGGHSTLDETLNRVARRRLLRPDQNSG
jgi:hypothetical protein